MCGNVYTRVGVCAPKHISIAITGNFVNGGATDDQCPLTFIYSFYVRFTGSRAAHLRVSGHVSNVAIDASTESAREDQRILDPIWGSMEEGCDRNMEIRSVSNFRRRKFVENLVLVCREERWKCLHAKCNNWRNRNFSQFLTFRIRNWKKKRKKNTYLNNV